jgi:hypothetical protein
MLEHKNKADWSINQITKHPINQRRNKARNNQINKIYKFVTMAQGIAEQRSRSNQAGDVIQQ